MRIVSGEKRGYIISAPSGMNTRPTQDKVREAVFGMYQFDIPGSRILDLFSGSGAIGLEALSRGATFAVFNDISSKSIKIIQENITKLGYSEKSLVLCMDYSAAISKLSSANREFDFIFIDPPYRSGVYEEVLEALIKSGLLAQNGRIIIERLSDMKLLPVKGLTTEKQKRYGKTTIEVFNESSIFGQF